MSPRLSASEVTAVPGEVSVQDFDQLDADTQQYVVELARSETTVDVPAGVATALVSSGLVKYTGYLRVQVREVSETTQR